MSGPAMAPAASAGRPGISGFLLKCNIQVFAKNSNLQNLAGNKILIVADQ
jgi:hypothetical protein